MYELCYELLLYLRNKFITFASIYELYICVPLFLCSCLLYVIVYSVITSAYFLLWPPFLGYFDKSYTHPFYYDPPFWVSFLFGNYYIIVLYETCLDYVCIMLRIITVFTQQISNIKLVKWHPSQAFSRVLLWQGTNPSWTLKAPSMRTIYHIRHSCLHIGNDWCEQKITSGFTQRNDLRHDRAVYIR